MKKAMIILLLAVWGSVASFAQMAKCKGKYFGNVIGSSVPSNYGGLWNQVTPENGTKWGVVEKVKGKYDWTEADLSYNWAKKNGALFKFHTFVWGSQMPDWVATATVAELTESLENYMKAAVAHFEPMGGLELIDVLNEPANPVLSAKMKAALTAGYKAEPANAKDLNNIYGWAIWPYQLARKYFPDATLLTNDYNIEQDWNGMRAPYIVIINAIKKAPNLTDGSKNLIDGVGLQCHGVMDLSAEKFKACIDEMWNSTGLPIHITEFDQSASPNETKQKDVYQSLITVAWEHPHVAGITLWGYVQGSTWIKGNNILGPGGTDSGLQYSASYTAAPLGDRPAMKWLRQYFATKPNLACCPAPASMGACPIGAVPAVAITSPASSSRFAAPATITFTATAKDADGTIAQVSYYSGAKLLGRSKTAPYSVKWTNAPAGIYTIKAIAIDNIGNKTVSAPITVTVSATYVYQCSGCLNDTWTASANWAPQAVPSLAIDTAVIRTGEVKVAADVLPVVKVESAGTFRLTDSVAVLDLRLQGGTLKSFTSTPVFILTTVITAEKASAIVAGSAAASTFRIDGTIRGSGTLTKTGAGTLQINANAASFTGNWIVNEGKLKLRNPAALGQCGVTVRNTGNLDVEASASTYALVVENGGKVTLDNNLKVQAAVFGALNIPAGTYRAADYPAFLSSGGTLTVTGTLLSYTETLGKISFTAQTGSTYQWYKDAAPAATGSIYLTDAEGRYSVLATNAAGCRISSAPVDISFVKTLTQTIELQQGWNLISINVVPLDSTIATLFATADVREIKNASQFWSADQPNFLNSIQAIIPGAGYLVNMNEAGILTVTGTPVSETATQKTSLSNWRLIGCPYQTATPIIDAGGIPAGILGGSFSELKDFSSFTIPGNANSSLLELVPGKAYFVR